MVEAPLTNGWQAELNLQFACQGSKTVLVRRQQFGPLAVQRPFYPEGDVCHAYVLHPPGGVVGGDQLQLNVQIEHGAHALLTTPGATKFYRSAGLQAVQQQRFQVNEGCLEWLPQETILFPAAYAQIHTRVDLTPEARYLGWEINCLGRPVISERFNPGQALFKTALYRQGKPLYLDRLAVNHPQDLDAAAGLRAQPVVATLLATNAQISTLEKAREWCNPDKQAGATLFNGVLVVRYLGNSTAQAHHLFRHIWQAIRPEIVGRAASMPRIWNT